MKAESIKPNMEVLYTGLDKFGFPNEHTNTMFTVVSRSWDEGSNQWLFEIKNQWNEERVNVPASVLTSAEATLDEEGF